MSLKLPGLGELDFDPQLDLGDHSLGSPEEDFRLAAASRSRIGLGRIEIAGEQAEPEVFEHALAMGDRRRRSAASCSMP